MRSVILIISVLVFFSACRQGSQAPPVEKPSTFLNKGVVLVDYREQQKVDVYVDGDLFTSYTYPPDMDKPVLFPVRSASGTIVTRGFPGYPREWERRDHPEHVGIWFNYGNVNDFDFWNAPAALSGEKKSPHGRVLHRGVKRAESRDALGVLEVAADWQVPAENGRWHTVLQENTIYEFSGDETTRTIDRITRLTAQEDEVRFSDHVDGLFAIRLDRAFTFPEASPPEIKDEQGNLMEVPAPILEEMNAHYLNSEAAENTDVQNQRADWVAVSSAKGEEQITIALFDHPENPGYPSFWNAGGEGLISVNNFGQGPISSGKLEALNFRLSPGESVLFRHRLYITSGSHATNEKLDDVFSGFSQK